MRRELIARAWPQMRHAMQPHSWSGRLGGAGGGNGRVGKGGGVWDWMLMRLRLLLPTDSSARFRIGSV